MVSIQFDRGEKSGYPLKDFRQDYDFGLLSWIDESAFHISKLTVFTTLDMQ